MVQELFLGNMKYSGEALSDGIFDARNAAQALIGFDNIVRFFLKQEDSIFEKTEINLPVKIKKGSREVMIPELIEKYITIKGSLYTIITIGGASYIKSLSETAAKDGLLKTGPAKDIKTIFKSAFFAIQRIIKIVKHLSGVKKDKVKAIPVLHDNQFYVQITNKDNIILLVPKKYYEIYLVCPPDLFDINAGLIDQKTQLSFGTFNNSQEQKETISIEHRSQFIKEVVVENDDTIILPDLKHGDTVELEGEINRISEIYNNLGFGYMGHTVTIRPKNGSLINFKDVIISESNQQLFPRVKVKGIIDRLDTNGNLKKKKPEIIFTEVISLEANDNRLF